MGYLWDLGFGVLGLGFTAQVLGFRGLGFVVQTKGSDQIPLNLAAP